MSGFFLTDGDGQFDISQLAEWLPLVQKNELILGYRVNRAEGWRRALNAKLFKSYIDSLFHLGVKDIDCAFKLMKRTRVQALPLISTGALISTEILYRLKQKKARWIEMPVQHLPRRYGRPTGNNPRIILKAFVESFQLWKTLRTS